MQPDSYDAVTDALAKLGLVGQMQNENTLIVSSHKGPVWPNRGNSFWLSCKEGCWYLSTWLPAGYRVPADQDPARSKRGRGEPHSKTLARGRERVAGGEAFEEGVRFEHPLPPDYYDERG